MPTEKKSIESVEIPLEKQFSNFDPNLLERRRQVWELHCARASRRQIATQISKAFNIPHYNEVDVYRDIQHGYQRVLGEYESDIREQFHLEMENLANCHLKIWPAVQKGDLKAIQIALSISDRRCQLLGLDKTQRLLIENSVSTAIAEILDSISGVLDEDAYEKVVGALRN
jgi:hypothetical protein